MKVKMFWNNARRDCITGKNNRIFRKKIVPLGTKRICILYIAKRLFTSHPSCKNNIPIGISDLWGNITQHKTSILAKLTYDIFLEKISDTYFPRSWHSYWGDENSPKVRGWKHTSQNMSEIMRLREIVEV